MENLAADCQRLVNLYPTLIESGQGASRGAKYAYTHTPGTSLFCTLPKSPVRALWGGNNRMFAIGGDSLYELNGAGAVIGTWAIGGAAGPGQIVSNGNQLLVWDGSLTPFGFNTWLITGGGPAVPVISSVGITFMRGYFIALRPYNDFGGDPLPINTPNQTQFNWSAPLDGSTWDPLDYIIKTSSPDAVLSILGPGSFNGGPEELWLIGKKTISVWYNSPLPPPADPFSEVQGAFVNVGLWAKNSVVGFPRSIVLLGADDRGNGRVYAMNGYTPVRISDYAMENRIRQYNLSGTDESDSIAYGYQENGHEFYVLTFPTHSKQIVLDLQSKQWHERAQGTNIAALTAPPAMFHVAAFGSHFVGDLNSGNIWQMSRTTYTHGGSSILRMRVAPHLNNERKMMFYPRVQLDVGGPFAGNRSYTLENSNDGGLNYGTPKTTVVGPTGESLSRVIWRRLGHSRDRVFRFTSQNALPEMWVDGYVEVEPGRAL